MACGLIAVAPHGIASITLNSSGKVTALDMLTDTKRGDTASDSINTNY